MNEDPRRLFEIPDDVAYFNCASAGPLPRAARLAIEAAVARRAQPWRITMQHWIDDFEARRTAFARLTGVGPETIALVPSASYGAEIAARNLGARAGQRILLLADDFPSDVYAWRAFAARHNAEILTLQRAPDATWTDAILAALDDRVAVVAVPHVHWTDGALVDLVRVGEQARAVGAALVIDASQSFGVLPLDLAAVRPDFLVTVGYKWLLGPYALSYLYVDPRHHDGDPLEQNWLSRLGSEDFRTLAIYQDAYRPGATRFDMGERSALELSNGALASLDLLNGYGVADIAARIAPRSDRIAAEAGALGLSLACGPERGPHLVGLALPPGSVERAASLFDAHQVFVSIRGESIRIASHIYTSKADIDRLVAALAALV